MLTMTSHHPMYIAASAAACGQTTSIALDWLIVYRRKQCLTINCGTTKRQNGRYCVEWDVEASLGHSIIIIIIVIIKPLTPPPYVLILTRQLSWVHNVGWNRIALKTWRPFWSLLIWYNFLCRTSIDDSLNESFRNPHIILHNLLPERRQLALNIRRESWKVKQNCLKLLKVVSSKFYRAHDFKRYVFLLFALVISDALCNSNKQTNVNERKTLTVRPTIRWTIGQCDDTFRLVPVATQLQRLPTNEYLSVASSVCLTDDTLWLADLRRSLSSHARLQHTVHGVGGF